MSLTAQQLFRIIFYPLLSIGLLALPGIGQAHTSVAWVQDQAVLTTYAAWDFAKQREADEAALEGCRTRARTAGLGKLASMCRVAHRQTGAGAGAIVCGRKGCATRTGYDAPGEAMDVAYQSCVQEKYENCQTSEITTWWDEVGYENSLADGRARAKTQAKPTANAKGLSRSKACRPPAGPPIRSTTHCNNADCTRTFANGCAVKFQAPYCLDASTGKWDWKADGC